MDEKNGSIKISEDVIASIAVTAALEIDGVVRVAQKMSGQVKSIIPNIKPTSHGVSVVRTDNGLDLTVPLVVSHGCKIKEISVAVQQNVIDAVSNMTGIAVSRVNIIVVGVVGGKTE